VTPTATALQLSHRDRAPLISCGRCRQFRERSGGVFRGSRFVCRACFFCLVFVLAQISATDGSYLAATAALRPSLAGD